MKGLTGEVGYLDRGKLEGLIRGPGLMVASVSDKLLDLR